MKAKKGRCFLWMAAVLVTAAVCFCLRNRYGDESAHIQVSSDIEHRKPSRNPKVSAATKHKMPVATLRRTVGDTPELSPAGRRLLAKIEAAYDADDLQETLSLFERARDSPDPEVRVFMVWSLGWFGKQAIRQLTEFLADADAEVANDALGQWDSAIQEVTDEGEKVWLIESAMERLTDKEALDDVALEYAGIDEKLAVESLLRVLSGNNRAAAAQARETYETITGKPFTSKAAAYQWLLQQD